MVTIEPLTGTPHALGTVSAVFAEALLLYVGYGMVARATVPAIRERLAGGSS
jgi:hypothetical protein